MGYGRMALIAMGVLTRVAVACGASPTASLTVSGDAVQPAGAPVILQLSVRNTGKSRISYWCAGPGEYPDAAVFVATVAPVGAPGKPLKLILDNGQWSGPGRAFDLAPGRSITFPATIGPVLPGRYRITIEGAAQGRGEGDALKAITWPATRSDNALEFEVRHDNPLAGARDAHIVAGVRANEPFARHLASTWPRKGVRDALVVDLAGDDVVAADRAADGLWGDADPAAVDGPLVASVILKHLAPPAGESDVGLMTRLTAGSKSLASEQLKAAMAKLVLARPEGQVRSSAAAALERGVTLPLAGPTYSLADAKRFEWPNAFANVGGTEAEQRQRHDAALLGAMLDLARSEDPHERKLAYRALTDLAQNPAAAQAVERGLKDPDIECARVAERSMEVIHWRNAERAKK